MPGSGLVRGPNRSLQQGNLESESMQQGISDSSSRRDLVQRGIANSSQPDDKNAAVNSGTQSSQANSSAGSRPAKRGRGPTRGLLLAKKGKTDVRVVLSNNRIVGEDAANVLSEIGIVVRDHVPFNVRRWKQIHPDDKNKMWEMIKDKFQLPENEGMKKAVMTQLNKAYRNYRSYLHVYNYKPC